MVSPIKEIESRYQGETMWSTLDGNNYRCFQCEPGRFRVIADKNTNTIWGEDIAAVSPESAVMQHLAKTSPT